MNGIICKYEHDRSIQLRLCSLKALVNEDTLLRKHCYPWCFLRCANWETFVADTKCFWTKSKTFFVSRTQNLCPQQMFRARANGETFVSATMRSQQCVLVCQSLKIPQWSFLAWSLLLLLRSDRRLCSKDEQQLWERHCTRNDTFISIKIPLFRLSFVKVLVSDISMVIEILRN